MYKSEIDKKTNKDYPLKQIINNDFFLAEIEENCFVRQKEIENAY